MKGIGMKEIVEDIRKLRKGRDLCVVGAANVGKSTFLNALMKHLVERKWQHNHRKYMKLAEVTVDELNDPDAVELLNVDSSDVESETETTPRSHEPEVFLHDGESFEMYEDADDEHREVTTSPLPGTTLAVQHLPVVANNELFNILDTPGLIVNARRQKLIEVLALDGAAQLKNVFPTKSLPVRHRLIDCILPWRTDETAAVDDDVSRRERSLAVPRRPRALRFRVGRRPKEGQEPRAARVARRSAWTSHQDSEYVCV
ncbi:hypothetical protein PINS_up004518 [Pythium insidiosum]|nr:hypothetical protein PINS_up004518 [Pythium insidiosum]